jgi:hypothetical protein
MDTVSRSRETPYPNGEMEIKRKSVTPAIIFEKSTGDPETLVTQETKDKYQNTIPRINIYKFNR